MMPSARSHTRHPFKPMAVLITIKSHQKSTKLLEAAAAAVLLLKWGRTLSKDYHLDL